MARTKKAGKKEEKPAAAAAAAAAGDEGPSTSYDAVLPATLEEQRTRIICKPDRNLHVRGWPPRTLALAACCRNPLLPNPGCACARRPEQRTWPPPLPLADHEHDCGEPVGQHGRGCGVRPGPIQARV